MATVVSFQEQVGSRERDITRGTNFSTYKQLNIFRSRSDSRQSGEINRN